LPSKGKYTVNVTVSFFFWYLKSFYNSHFETSAKEGTNIEEAFQLIAKSALQQESSIELYDEQSDPIRLDELDNSDVNKCAC
jgi:GTPase SAR1 family protein